MDAEMLRNVLTMLGTVLGAILVLMLVAKITSMVHVEADDARAPIDYGLAAEGDQGVLVARGEEFIVFKRMI